MAWWLYVLLAGAVPLGAATLVSMTPSMRRREQRRLEAWRAVSKKRGGAFYEAGMTLDVPEGEVVVRVTTVPGDPVSTSVSALFPIEAGPVFAGPSTMGFGPAARGGKAPPDVVLGRPGMSHQFILASPEPHRARRAWTQRAVELLLGRFRRCWVVSNGRTVEMVLPWVLDSAEDLDAAIDIVRDVATSDVFGVGALRALEGARYEAEANDFNVPASPHVLVGEPSPVTVGPALIDGQLVTRATAAAPDRARREIRVGDGGQFEPAPSAELEDDDGAAVDASDWLGAEAIALLGRVGPGVLTSDAGELAFRWLSVEEDPQRLRAGVELLAALGRGADRGVYR